MAVFPSCICRDESDHVKHSQATGDGLLIETEMCLSEWVVMVTDARCKSVESMRSKAAKGNYGTGESQRWSERVGARPRVGCLVFGRKHHNG